MSKMISNGYMDTVSSDSESIVYKGSQGVSSFQYMDFCRKIIKMSKRNVDACFLVPLKMYHNQSESLGEDSVQQIEIWLDIFQDKMKPDYTKNEEVIAAFWVYLEYCNGFNELKKQSVNTSFETDLKSTIKGSMNDVSKLEKGKYIKKLLENRNDVECWILRAYELSLRKMYAVSKLVKLIKDSVEYLRKCDINIDMPAIIDTNKNGEYLYQTAAGIMLLIMRLRINIETREAIDWYRKGNISYVGAKDRMLEEYIRLVNLYSYQSYERFISMEQIARENKNKYAAKEIGDIYRLGALLGDMYGNRIQIIADQEKACEYYRYAMENEFIPAYTPALKTGSVINERQKEEILRKATIERSQEGLAYYAQKCIQEAEDNIRKDETRVQKLLQEAIDAMLLLEDTYGEKFVLKNQILLSKVFKSYREKEKDDIQKLNEDIQKLYVKDIWNLSEEDFATEVEKNYVLAGKLGYYEAEYKIGMLFLETDCEKSEQHFEQGKNMGCKWCMLEYVKMLRKQNPKAWLTEMISLGKCLHYEEKELWKAVAKEWVDCEDLLQQIIGADSQQERDKVQEICWQMEKAIEVILGGSARENVELLGALSVLQKKLKQNILIP